MHLKRLEFVGFKSFATRTTAEVQPGIVVVVGPNGSGKSNLADGVRWVLGEQSPRAIRARRPDEVIFAGSGARQPLGMAEVSLVLDNADRAVPLDYAELKVTRRLYRNGDSEYLLNGTRVRLKDISHYLLHARLGPDSYCVIGQGSVDELILQRPDERRVAFENAADIRRHQLKLQETRNKVAATEANLTRVQDVMAELAPHVRRLKGQADRARRARALHGELRALSERYFRLRHQYVGAEVQAAEMALLEAQRAVADAEGAGAALLEERASVDDALQRTAEQLAVLRPRLEALRDQERAVERALAVSRERAEATREQQTSTHGEIERLRQREAALQDEVQARARLCDDAPHALGVAEHVLADLRERVARRSAAATEMAQALGVARARRDELEARTRAAEGDAERADQRVRQHEAQAAVDGARRADRVARMREVADALCQLEQRGATLGAQTAEARDRMAAAEAARQPALAGVQRARTEATAAAQHADRLHGQLEALGVPSSADERDGAGLLAALDGLEVLGVAADLAARVRPLDRLVRGYLRRTVVVPDDATARAAHARLSAATRPDDPAWAVLSLDGTLFPAAGERPMEAATGDESALADWRGRVRELEAQRAAALGDRARFEAALACATTTLAEAEAAAAAAWTQHEQVNALLEQTTQLEARTRAEHGALSAELEEVAGRVNDSGRTRQQAQEAAARAADELARVRADREAAIAGLAEAERRSVLAAEELSSARADLAQADAEERARRAERNTQEQVLARAQRDLEAVREQRAAAERRQAELERLLDDLGEREARLLADVEGCVTDARPLSEALARLEREHERLLGTQRAAEPRLADLRATERHASDLLSAARVRNQRAQDARVLLDRELADAAELDDEVAEHDAAVEARGRWSTQLRLALLEDRSEGAIVPAADLEADRTRLHALQRQVRLAAGPGASVVDEFRELSDRHTFLEQQSLDLRAAMAELRQAADELEAHMRERFAEVFEAVNAAFQACFTRLFDGGEARLVLTQPDHLLESGVDILARPPGKKLQALLSLSGGERALTIVALLFGLLKVNPTPFCVLDEVDAALDEANVQRFAGMLEEFSRQIQFVVVSHNRATMEIADALYGVSMDASGVSRLYSVQPRVLAGAGAA